MVTSRDVARVAGVSQATVSRVLHDSPLVTGATRRLVVRALEETGYAPNALARAMKTHRTGTIGVVVARITNPFYPQLLEALGARLAAVDRRMILWDSEGPGEASAIEAIRQGLVDGLVFTAVTAESAPLREALRHDAAVVLVNRGVTGAACDQVTSDNVGGAGTVAGYFVAAGHERIGMIGGPTDTTTATEREEGFFRGLAEAGVVLPDEYSPRGDFSHAQGHAAMRRLLALPQPATAVFCVNDLTAFGAIDGARSAGARIPEDVWVVGFDDVDMASWEAFDLTTVRQPIGDMADMAVSLLLARIEHRTRPPEHRRFPSGLVLRGSTAHHAI